MSEMILSSVLTALHIGARFARPGSDVMLAPLLVLGGFASVALVGMAVLALTRRRSRSYLLITIALGALAFKAFLGGLFLIQLLPSAQHHLLEHGMDFVTAALLIAAIYYARTVSRERDAEGLR